MSQINLRPKARQFPFDETCSDLISLLEARNFNIPGISVRFSEYGSYKMVSVVEGSDFRLWFCRNQGSLSNRYNDIAAISQIVIEDISISVYSDGSGPSLYIYVGNNLQKDMKWWLCNSWDLNARLNGRARKAIYYQGSCRENGSYFQAHSNHYLVHSDDLGRGYSPIELDDNQTPHHSHNWSIDKEKPTHDLPNCILTSSVFDWVNEKLKKRIENLNNATV